MKIYYLKMLLFTFLINTLVLFHNENYINNHYNLNLIQNNTKITTIKSRILAKTQIHNPHYHNDPELKEIIDKMNEEAIKKYQKNHDPYEQLKDVVEKNGRKYTGRHGEQPMSTIEKELLETYEEMFGNESDMLKSGMSPNVDEKSSTCECTIAAKSVIITSWGETVKNCITSISILHMLTHESMSSALTALGIEACSADLAGATTTATAIFEPCGIAALVLLILAVVLIILYIWLYRRRKNSWKHECKKHLCK
ncbi:hypothetical protein PFFVO_06128 [Plasmodium falciparum Vietnam Oak-Knoll (FVO)]|uniref:Surface antigen n=1 Tax=Plasmodium falciparum Vietnam Oak-Knoll (FVO) TaxID=1036723 RepID=A0A024UY65_PLAFA|nr:hypothetical protein PFFVO_06128 [Plasmodium falciparum Vietnam Oak-Knoll (FVO)]